MNATALVLGVVAAVALIAAIRGRGPQRERRVCAIGLIVAALIYVGFALANPSSSRFGIELLGVALFGTVAGLGLRYSPLLLALGWSAHAAWDVFLHGASSPRYVPAWYPSLCIGFDLVVAGYVAISLSRREPDQIVKLSGRPPDDHSPRAP